MISFESGRTVIRNCVAARPSTFDKLVIKKWLLENNSNPYNRKHLTMEILEKYNKKENVVKRVDKFRRELNEWKRENYK